MSALSALCLTLCAVGAGVSLLSSLAPQKRTGRVMSFVIGLFVILSVMRAVSTAVADISADVSLVQPTLPDTFSEDDRVRAVAQRTAKYLVEAADELLRAEGITADDIRISLKISDEGRIYADRVDIYINEASRDREDDIEAIIYRNLAKEPDIYVTGQEAE